MTSDGGEASRALMVLLLHQLVDIRSRTATARQTFDYTCRQNGTDPDGCGYVTSVALDVAGKAVDQSIDQVTHWLKAQVIALYDPASTTDRLLSSRTPPHSLDD